MFINIRNSYEKTSQNLNMKKFATQSFKYSLEVDCKIFIWYVQVWNVDILEDVVLNLNFIVADESVR